MITSIVIGVSSFAMVCARAFQQLNVMHHRMGWVIPTSMVMALMEVTIVLNVVATGFSSVLPLAVGGSAGCLTAMIAHRKLRE